MNEEYEQEQEYSFKRPLFNLKELKKRQEIFDKKVGRKKVEYEFQEICLEMNEWFGQKCWFIFYRHDLQSIKEAFEICKSKDIKKVNYLIGIIKRS